LPWFKNKNWNYQGSYFYSLDLGNAKADKLQENESKTMK
jgi:hypothetical protein